MNKFKRGEVVGIDRGYGPHYYVVVSADLRNRNLDTVLGARLTSKRKPDFDTVIPLGAQDHPLHGWVLCDNIVEIAHGKASPRGRLSSLTMKHVDDGLRAALDLK